MALGQAVLLPEDDLNLACLLKSPLLGLSEEDLFDLAYGRGGSSLIDRLQQGNWFEDPSYSAIDCAASGPVTVGNISLSAGGEEIFKQQRSLIWKSLRVSRVYDKANNSLIYLAHARELQMGSGKMSLSVVPLNGVDVTWSNGQPQ